MRTISPAYSLDEILNHVKTYDNLSTAELIEKALVRNEGCLTKTGALQVNTGEYTGRSPKDKFIVKEPLAENKINWGPINQPMEKETFQKLYDKVLLFLGARECFVFRGFAGADHSYQLPIQVITEYAWHNLFAHQLFIRPTDEELVHHHTAFTVLDVPSFHANPEVDGTHSEAFIIISFEKRIILIGGTEYAGEIKKSIFSVMNALLPEKNVLPMHCSANVGTQGDVALFFGLSGTGKTTLSADPERRLIGDDEHGWSKDGVFNIEGGCYAKCVHLSKEKEPQIWEAIQFGTVLENVIMDRQNRVPDYNDTSLTENTRAAYPIESIPNTVESGHSGHPDTIILLTADASGILPPISKLTKEQTMYHFISGYTSKLAGTERGVTSPEATFSTCFAAPFLPLPPHRYTEMLGDRIDVHHTQVFLINTGWTGGEYGVGHRVDLTYTRAMVRAALNHRLTHTETIIEPVFGLHIPVSCPGVPDDVLQPRNTWQDVQLYDEKAKVLSNAFKSNFKKFESISPEIAQAGPR